MLVSKHVIIYKYWKPRKTGNDKKEIAWETKRQTKSERRRQTATEGVDVCEGEHEVAD